MQVEAARLSRIRQRSPSGSRQERLPSNEADICGCVREHIRDWSEGISSAPRIWRHVAASVADVRLSAVTGDGEQALIQAVLERCGALGEQPLLLALNQRQSDLAVTAAEALARSEQVAADGLPWDFWTIDLRQAIRSLGEITGEQLTESVLDRIFSRFCIGK